MIKLRRIFITGASGTGKTTLAKYISEKYGLPFISASAREVWPKFGFHNHAEAIRQTLVRPSVGYDYQMEIFRNRHKALSNAPEFVTDRSPIDNYAYFLLQQGYLSEQDNDHFKNLCLEDYKLGDAVIFLRVTNDMEIENNGRRIVNLTYQRMVDSVLRMVLWKEFYEATLAKEITTIDTWDLETRKGIIKGILENEG